MDEFTELASKLYLNGMSLSQVASEMSTSAAWISRKLRAAGIPPKRRTRNFWTEKEDLILTNNHLLTDAELTLLLPGRTCSGVSSRRKAIGLLKSNNLRHVWTTEDYDLIDKNSTLTDSELAELLQVSESSVKSARKRKQQHKIYTCKVCGELLKSQGMFCKKHSHVGKQLSRYLSKSAIKGREFSLSKEEIYKLITSPCVYCGGDGYGIDRVDSKKGYVHGNVVSCCTTCNIMKNDMEIDAFKAHVAQIVAHTGVE